MLILKRWKLNQLDTLQHYDVDTEAWEEDINAIEENFDKYFQFERMDSKESFRVMEDLLKLLKMKD